MSLPLAYIGKIKLYFESAVKHMAVRDTRALIRHQSAAASVPVDNSLSANFVSKSSHSGGRCWRKQYVFHRDGRRCGDSYLVQLVDLGLPVGDLLCGHVSTCVLGEVIAAHEAPITDGAHELLLSCVSPAVA